MLSYSAGNTNEYWLVNGGAIAGQSVPGSPQSLDPGRVRVSRRGWGFSNSYNIAIGDADGTGSANNGSYNYQVSKDGQTGTLLPQG